MEADNSRHATGIALRELAERCGAELAGDGELMIYRVATLEDADAGSISFLSNIRYRAQLASTRAGAVIVAPRDAQATPLPKLVTSNPYAVYARVASIFHPPTVAVPGIHPRPSLPLPREGRRKRDDRPLRRHRSSRRPSASAPRSMQVAAVGDGCSVGKT